MVTQVNYTSKDFASIRSDLINVVKARIPEWKANDSSDFTLALVEAFSYLGDLVTYYVDRAANEATPATATQISNLVKFAELAGYKPSGPRPGFVVLTFKNLSASALNIPVGTQATANLVGKVFTQAYYETIQGATNVAAGASVDLIALEGKTKSGGLDSLYNITPVVLGTSNGSAYLEYVLPDAGVVDDSVVVYTGENSGMIKWNYIWNLVEAGPYDQVFSTKFNSDGTTSIVFGDGFNGATPDPGQKVSATYRYSVGAAGNVGAKTITSVSFVPGVGLNPTSLSVTNDDSAYGGSDGDNLSLIRKNIGLALSTKQSITTLNDYENVALEVPGVGRVNAAADVYTSVNLYIQPLYDNTSTPGMSGSTPTTAWNRLASAVGSFVSRRAPVGATVTVLPPTYVSVDLTLTVKSDSAHKQRDINIAVAKALIDVNVGLFSYNSFNFGDTVSLSNIYSTLMAIEGVTQVDISKLCRHGGSGAANITLTAGEIPILTAANLSITVTGGIA
jgi:uncharacterized phage protein gp47/JayE